MNKPRTPETKHPNHPADLKNPNRGTRNTNKTWDQAQGNRGKQLNPNQPGPDGGKQTQ